MAGDTVNLALGRDVPLASRLAHSTMQRMAQGESTGGIIRSSAQDIGANVVTMGMYGTAREYVGMMTDYSSGQAGIDEIEQRLQDTAGQSVLNAGLGAVASKVSGQGWKGPDVPGPAAIRQGMRQAAQKAAGKARVVAESASQLGGRAMEGLHQGMKRLHGGEPTTLGRIEPRIRSESVAHLKSIRRHTQRLVRGRAQPSNPAQARQVRSIQRAIARGQFGRAGTRYHSLNFRMVRQAQAKGLLQDVIVDRSIRTPGGSRASRRPDYRIDHGELLDIKPWRDSPRAFDLTDQFQDIYGATGETPTPLYYKLW